MTAFLMRSFVLPLRRHPRNAVIDTGKRELIMIEKRVPGVENAAVAEKGLDARKAVFVYPLFAPNILNFVRA